MKGVFQKYVSIYIPIISIKQSSSNFIFYQGSFAFKKLQFGGKSYNHISQETIIGSSARQEINKTFVRALCPFSLVLFPQENLHSPKRTSFLFSSIFLYAYIGKDIFAYIV